MSEGGGGRAGSQEPAVHEAHLEFLAAGFPGARLERIHSNRRPGDVTYVLLQASNLPGPAFAKVANSPRSRDAIAREVRAYRALSAHANVPAFYGSEEQDGTAVLIIEDLSRGHWPPPWSEAHVQCVLDALNSIAELQNDLQTPICELAPQLLGWHHLRTSGRLEHAERALSLSPGTFERRINVLMALSEAALEPARDLLHFDVRSDNLCFRPCSTKDVCLLDWSWWCRGQMGNQLAAWAATLSSEWGRNPWELGFDIRIEHVALLCGYFTQFFAQPTPAPNHVRQLQARQARIMTSWMKHLGLL